MTKHFFQLIIFSLVVSGASAQELESKVTINSSKVSSVVDPKVFQTLQTGLQNFINNRKWTSETFQPNERIVCNFLLTIQKELGTNLFQASLVIQAGRPVYNSSYQTALINFQDDQFAFKYEQFQPIEFNDNRVQGTDAMVANLTAVFAYYAYVILALDYESFALRGGDTYFQKAMNIVNNAPENTNINGWRAFDGQRNRYWLVENFTNNKYNLMHDAFYSYFRLGMDHMYENEDEARTAMLNSLQLINTVNTEIPNSMIVQFFFQGRANELTKVFKKAGDDARGKALDILTKIDIANGGLYKQELR